jgi:hypothetical protein
VSSSSSVIFSALIDAKTFGAFCWIVGEHVFAEFHVLLLLVERFDHPDELAAGTWLDDQIHG